MPIFKLARSVAAIAVVGFVAIVAPLLKLDDAIAANICRLAGLAVCQVTTAYTGVRGRARFALG